MAQDRQEPENPTAVGAVAGDRVRAEAATSGSLDGAAVIAAGSRLELRYALTLANGFVADATDPDETLSLILGDGTLDPAFESRLIGVGLGRSRFDFEPGAVFGWPDPAAIQVLPRAHFPPGLALMPNAIVQFDLPTGEAIPGRVERVQGDQVIVDFNHPLAGRAFTLEVDVLSIAPAGAAAGAFGPNLR
ncbi:MAG: peptidylprolyl isomerase [Thioalkalivibrionaceae bacterium]